MYFGLKLSSARSAAIFVQLPPHPHIDHSQLYWASCLPSTFRTLLSPPTVTPRALWSCANLPFANLPSIPPEAHHHRLPLGHGVTQRYKPLMGALLLGWIHEDNLKAQWSSGPLVKSRVRGASGPSASYNQHLAAIVLDTPKNAHQNKLEITQDAVSASISVSFWQDPHWDWVEGWRRSRGENINEEMTLWWRRRWSLKADRDWQLISHERSKTDYVTKFQQLRKKVVRIQACIFILSWTSYCCSEISSQNLLTGMHHTAYVAWQPHLI